MIASLFATTPRRAKIIASQARAYLRGLLSRLPRKNMERMGKALEDISHESLQHFLTYSSWDEQDLFRWIALRASARLGGHRDSMLIIDETAAAKKGDSSVGVAMQHDPRLGRTENCQAGVFAALGCGNRAVLVGARLFLPQIWVADEKRCERAGVPKERLRAQTKLDLARELVDEAIRRGTEFNWVGLDRGYGNDPGMLCWLEDRQLGFVADVPHDLPLWSELPTGADAARSNKRPEPRRVEAMAKELMANHQSGLTTFPKNGGGAGKVWVRRIWCRADGQPVARCWWLIVRRDGSAATPITCTLCNAPPGARLEQLARLQQQRSVMQAALQDLKTRVGMTQYQARQWKAWHHHMGMVALAMFFLTEEHSLQYSDGIPPTHADVNEMLEWHFHGKTPTQTVTQKERRAGSA